MLQVSRPSDPTDTTFPFFSRSLARYRSDIS
jgi:hypothetical protein